MNYQQTLDYLYSSLPMYHRIGQAAYKPDLHSTLRLMERLGHPERGFRSIHVAGTNGKGSVSHLLASVLMQAGYKVGLYTSPHLIDFRERIRINGKMIPRQRVTDFVADHQAFMQTLQLSFFEMTVGLAFDYFARERVDVAVVEVGMGGRLDSTNVITPDLSVITNIGFDHTQFLGDTLVQIAAEKAGIIKPGVPVVIGETHPETRPVFERQAARLGAPICFADDRCVAVPKARPPRLDCMGLVVTIAPDGPEELFCPLEGSYQLRNICTAYQSLSLLPDAGYRFNEQHIRDGFAQVIAHTGLHGRWEKMASAPLTICETAHNADGVRAMLAKLGQLPYRRLHLIYGCVNDKDYRSILAMLPRPNTLFYYTQPSVPRGLPVDQLAAAARAMEMPGPAFATVGEAVQAARTAADPAEDLVLVTGSIFLVADALAYFRPAPAPNAAD